jgi:LuxR family maltose regulon positive regulatory protein
MQQHPLLRTKLYIPPIRRRSVSRPHLVERLNPGQNRKLTLISAPAGFGKTTLLSECAANCGRPVSWLSLDERDNDAARFWTYVIAALQTLCDGVGAVVLEVLQTPHALPNEVLLGQLINELAESPETLTLILDDLHVITNPQIHETLIFFTENLPAQMHLIASGRADPPWPLARWRARGQVVEIRTDDLRFNSAETAAFLKNAMGLDLSPQDMATLGARTEGWIAGLQLAALSMQGRDGRSFVRAFSGSHRFILDYLVEEVLDRQTSGLQEFLLQTSIVDRLTASLCDAVRFGGAESPSISYGTAERFGGAESPSRGEAATFTGREDSQAILEHLEQANLFLVPLDDERRWYRYHQLFADLLRNRLNQTHPCLLPELHRRASEWYEQHELIPDAASHALAAEDVERAARLVEGRALDMIFLGELTTLLGLLDALPDRVVSSRPWLCIAYAWALLFAGSLDTVEFRLESAETTLEKGGDTRHADRLTPSAADSQHIAGHIAAIRAYVAALRGDMSRAAELTREALGQLPQEDLAVRGLTAGLLSSALRWSGDLAAAAQALTSAIAISQAAGDDHTVVEALCSLAAVQLAQGQLHNTVATCQDALLLADEHARWGGRRLPIAATAYNLTSHVLCEWNDLEGALRHAREGIELSEQWGWAEGQALGYWRLARGLQALGDEPGAREALQKARQAASDLSPWFGALMAAHQARMWLAQRNLMPASQWAQESGRSADDKLGFQNVDAYSVLARVLIARGRLDEAAGLLTRLVEMTEAAGAMGHVIEALVLQALTLQAQGKEDQALATLAQALALGEPEGFVRTFIDEGPQMAQLLRRAVGHGFSVNYAGQLLAALEEAARAAVPLAISKGTRPPLAEPLSAREAEVLRLLTTHLSHAEIARELVVSVNTVRSHVKSIYGKLDVHSRMEAVARAGELVFRSPDHHPRVNAFGSGSPFRVRKPRPYRPQGGRDRISPPSCAPSAFARITTPVHQEWG